MSYLYYQEMQEAEVRPLTAIPFCFGHKFSCLQLSSRQTVKGQIEMPTCVLYCMPMHCDFV